MRRQWTFSLLSLILLSALAAGGYIWLNQETLVAQETGQNGVQNSSEAAVPNTIAVRPASTALGAVSAAGNIALVSQQTVVLQVAGTVDDIMVAAGDTVAAGTPLLTIERTDLERAARNAELSVRSIQNQIEELTNEDNSAAIAVAEAALATAEQSLADLLAGPDGEEIAAAQSNLAAAWSKYNELQAGPTEAELTQLSANLQKTEIALTEAQRAYDQIAWQGNAGMSSQAATLQSATIDYESAKAAYAQSVAAASTSELQSALSSAQSAQAQLTALQNTTSASEIAAAEANIVEAQATLNELMAGPAATELTGLNISLEQALLSLEEAYSNLEKSTVVAPTGGTVLAVNVGLGERYSEGTAVVTLADTSQLELTVDVVELDIARISAGQLAEIELDALPGQLFQGAVAYVAPTNDSAASTVSYPVTVRLNNDMLDGILPGMTAVATIQNDTVSASGWLVPSNAIRQQGESSVVLVVNEAGTTPVEVVPGAVNGEWTVVESSALQAGMQVVGSVTSFVSEEQNTRFGPGMGGGGIAPGVGGGARRGG